MTSPLERLRYHVTGAIERGERQAITEQPARDYGYLQHGQGTQGPFRTERVTVRHLYADKWQARFEGRWRDVHILVNRLYIVYRGERVTIQIDGL